MHTLSTKAFVENIRIFTKLFQVNSIYTIKQAKIAASCASALRDLLFY